MSYSIQEKYVLIKAMLGSSNSRRPLTVKDWFDPRAVHVGDRVDKVAMGAVILRIWFLFDRASSIR